MKPSRRSQPYRRGTGRLPGSTLYSMLGGRPLFMPNPMAVRRQTQRLARRKRK